MSRICPSQESCNVHLLFPVLGHFIIVEQKSRESSGEVPLHGGELSRGVLGDTGQSLRALRHQHTGLSLPPPPPPPHHGGGAGRGQESQGQEVGQREQGGQALQEGISGRLGHRRGLDYDDGTVWRNPTSVASSVTVVVRTTPSVTSATGVVTIADIEKVVVGEEIVFDIISDESLLKVVHDGC